MKRQGQSARYVIVLIMLLLIHWQTRKFDKQDTAPSSDKGTVVVKDAPALGGEVRVGVDADTPAQKTSAPASRSANSSATQPTSRGTIKGASQPAKVRGYDKFSDARLVDEEGNDGDSFMVKAGDRKFLLRLYFVDAPEKYLSDRYENQRRRVAEQAREMGDISSEQAVAIGLEAKEFTRKLLSGKTFTVYTYWEEVFDGDRYYGFVELADGSYLGALLVENGLARIHTKGPGSKQKPVPTPDGASFYEHRDKLEALERKALQSKRGAWQH